MMVHSALSRSISTEPTTISNARLAAELQMLTVALRIAGLEGLRSGAAKVGNTRTEIHDD